MLPPHPLFLVISITIVCGCCYGTALNRLSIYPNVVPADTKQHEFLLESHDPTWGFSWTDRISCRHLVSGSVRDCGFLEITNASDEGKERPVAKIYMRGTGGYAKPGARIKSIVAEQYALPGFGVSKLRMELAPPSMPD